MASGRAGIGNLGENDRRRRRRKENENPERRLKLADASLLFRGSLLFPLGLCTARGKLVVKICCPVLKSGVVYGLWKPVCRAFDSPDSKASDAGRKQAPGTGKPCSGLDAWDSYGILFLPEVNIFFVFIPIFAHVPCANTNLVIEKL